MTLRVAETKRRSPIRTLTERGPNQGNQKVKRLMRFEQVKFKQWPQGFSKFISPVRRSRQLAGN